LLDVTGLSKPQLLAAFYNAAAPRGMGFLQADPAPMTELEARDIIEKHGLVFDYVKGRPLKLDFEGDALDLDDYDEDCRPGRGEIIVEVLRAGGSPTDHRIVMIGHQLAMQTAEIAIGYAGTPTKIEGNVMTLGAPNEMGTAAQKYVDLLMMSFGPEKN
jgi:hypothetical protein